MAQKAEGSARPERAVAFTGQFRTDLRHWVKTDRTIALKILDLVEAVTRDPFQGSGKPEALKHQMAGAWSRRVTLEHRIAYEVSEHRIVFLQCSYHY